MKKFFLFILLIAIAAEIILRFFYLPPELNSSYYQDRILWLEQHAIINSAGYRDTPHQITRGDEALRIYSMGDSNSYGWYINNIFDRYTSLISQQLSKKLGKKVEVINAAQFGFSLKDELARFQTEGKLYHPDIVTVEVHSDSVNTQSTVYQPADYNVPDFIKQLRLYQLLIGQRILKETEEKNDERALKFYTDPKSIDWKISFGYLIQLKKEADKIGAHLVVILLPHTGLKNYHAKYTFYPYHKKYHDLASKIGFSIVDPIMLYLDYKNKQDLIISPLDSHISESMHKLIAQAFLAQFDAFSFLKNHERYLPIYENIELTESSNSIGNYQSIQKIESKKTLPWVYFENKGQDFEDLPLNSLASSQNHIYSDRLYTGENSGFGPQILYHLYEKSPGTLVIPEKLYGYPVIGFNGFEGIFQEFSLNTFGMNPISEPFTPVSIEKRGSNYVIHFNPSNNYSIIQAKVSIAVNELSVEQGGKIDSITKSSQLRKTLSQASSTVEFPLEGQLVGTAQLWDKTSFITSLGRHFQTLLELVDKTNTLKARVRKLLGLPQSVKNGMKLNPSQQQLFGLKTYAWVDGIFTEVKSVQENNKSIILTFDKTLKKGQVVNFNVRTSYPWKNNEAISLTVERIEQ